MRVVDDGAYKMTGEFVYCKIAEEQVERSDGSHYGPVSAHY